MRNISPLILTALIVVSTSGTAMSATRAVVVDPDTSDLTFPTNFFSANSGLVVDAIPWDEVHGGGTTAQRPSCTSTNDGFLYANSTTGTIQICDGGTWQTWVDLSDGFEDAPTDGKFYGRRNGVWESPTTFQGRGIEGGILQAPLSHANRSLQGFFKYKSSGAGGSTDEHWKIATLQESIGSQGNTLYVRLIGGRYLASHKGIVEVMISNRESERFWYWLRGTKPDQTGIRVFREADGKLSVYAFLGGGANNFNGFAVDAVMGNWENPGAFFSEVYSNPTNTGASPTGTLVFDSRTATPDWHIPYQAVPQVMGTNVSLVGHTHAASAITSGTIATARLGSGTASTNTFLRGDQTWASIDAVPSSRTVTAGTGLTGGGGLSTNLTLSANFGTTAGTIAEGNHTHPADDITSGTLAVARGGTGHTNYTVGDLLYASASGTLTKLGIGTAGQVLTVNGAGDAPSWETPSSGGGAGTVLAWRHYTIDEFGQLGTLVSSGGSLPITVTNSEEAHQFYVTVPATAGAYIVRVNGRREPSEFDENTIPMCNRKPNDENGDHVYHVWLYNHDWSGVYWVAVLETLFIEVIQ